MHHTRKLSGYVVVTSIIILCWAVSMPGWSWMFTTILNVSEPVTHVQLAMILFPFYILFMMGELLTSVMYSLGLTQVCSKK